MGHNAFEGSYRKPNLKLHMVIFLTIVGVSVFLSTQVEKTKNNVNVEALKTPVPIDSVFVDESLQQDNATIANNSVTPPVVRDQDTEYHFDNGPTLAAIDQMLAKHDESPASSDSNGPVNDAESSTALEEPARQKEKDVAIMVTEDEVQDQAILVSAEEVKTPITNEDVKNNKNDTKKVGKLDAVYELQQNRFLETLAKTATSNTEETLEIKRMKKAMQSDQPLKVTTSIQPDSASTEDNSPVIKVAVTGSSEIENAKSKNKKAGKLNGKPKTIVATKVTSIGEAGNKKSEKRRKEELLLTRSELNNVLSQFARSYNRGDIQRLMALFDDNAVTNDQRSKNGIKAEYAELFSSTSDRNIKIKNIQWDLGKGKARGDARFTVTVKPTGSSEIAQIEGRLEILAVKESRGVFIKSLLHEVSAR